MLAASLPSGQSALVAYEIHDNRQSVTLRPGGCRTTLVPNSHLTAMHSLRSDLEAPIIMFDGLGVGVFGAFEMAVRFGEEVDG